MVDGSSGGESSWGWSGRGSSGHGGGSVRVVTERGTGGRGSRSIWGSSGWWGPSSDVSATQVHGRGSERVRVVLGGEDSGGLQRPDEKAVQFVRFIVKNSSYLSLDGRSESRSGSDEESSEEGLHLER